MKKQYSILVLSNGFVTILDTHVYRRVKKHRWHVHRSAGKGRKAGNYYVRGYVNGKRIYLHRFITACPKGFQPDHKNTITLDNRL